MLARSTTLRFDWLMIFLYFALVFIGWINIYSASLNDNASGYFDFSQIYGKQMLWIALSFFLIPFILAIDSKFYERFASVIYLISIVSLIGLFVFENIAGQTAWYSLSFSIQPSEFVKAATALALAKYLSDIQTNLKEFRSQVNAFLILTVPMLLILLQPDPGSVLIYLAFSSALSGRTFRSVSGRGCNCSHFVCRYPLHR